LYAPPLALTSRGDVVYVGSDEGVFKIIKHRPVPSIDSDYCATSSWTINVTNGAPDTAVRLLGTSDGQPWGIVEWVRTDADGSFDVEGIFSVETIDTSHTLRVEIDGALSNTIAFTVFDCRR
jgi:hypothetical protein